MRLYFFSPILFERSIDLCGFPLCFPSLLYGARAVAVASRCRREPPNKAYRVHALKKKEEAKRRIDLKERNRVDDFSGRNFFFAAAIEESNTPPPSPPRRLGAFSRSQGSIRAAKRGEEVWEAWNDKNKERNGIRSTRPIPLIWKRERMGNERERERARNSASKRSIRAVLKMCVQRKFLAGLHLCNEGGRKENAEPVPDAL